MSVFCTESSRFGWHPFKKLVNSYYHGASLNVGAEQLISSAAMPSSSLFELMERRNEFITLSQNGNYYQHDIIIMFPKWMDGRTKEARNELQSCSAVCSKP